MGPEDAKDKQWTPFDKANNPFDEQVGGSHYKNMGMQPIEYILANNIPYTEGAIIKYITRWRAKGGLEDLKKAQHFLAMLIKYEVEGSVE